MDRISFSPKIFKSAEGVPSDNFFSLKLERTTKPILEYDITNIVNQQEQFEKERLEVRSYRFSGKINIFTANELTQTEKVTNPDGSTTIFVGALNEDWDPLFDGNPSVAPNNWVIQLLYPHKKEPDYNIVSYVEEGPLTNIVESKACLGPQIKSLTLSKPVGEEEKVGVSGIQKHNLQQEDYVYIYDNTTVINPYTGIYRVISLGINGENLDTNFTIDTNYIGSHFTPCNYRRILNATTGDINFSNPVEINTITASDFDGNTLGSFSLGDTIYSKIETQDKHNIFKLTGGTGNPYVDLRGSGILNGIFEVISIINDFTFTIKLEYFNVKGQSQTFSSNKPKVRPLDGAPSEYYVRKFKVLTTNDYDSYKCAFSSSIYPKTIVNTFGIANGTWLYHFNEDIDVEPLVDHNNKPLTNLYMAFIKRAGQNTFPWGDVVAGWEFNRKQIKTSNGLEKISKFNSGGVGSLEKPNKSFDYIGDYAEYNRVEIEEKVVSKIVHRFGKATEPNEEGYYLEPFKEMNIMNFSSVIDNSELGEPTEGIPNYAEVYPNGIIAWKNLLPIGFIEPDTGVGVNYPFVNGKHYFYGNYNFYIRRQLPPLETTEPTKNRLETVKISEIQDVC